MLHLFKLIASALIGKFLYLTDIHYDPDYAEGSPNKCFLGNVGITCCHNYDIHTFGATPANKWGDYNCDTSPLFFNKSMEWIQHHHPHIDMIMFPGDSAGHEDIYNTPGVILDSVDAVFHQFKKKYPTTPVLSALGNHETYPIDQTTPILYPYLLHNFGESMKKTLPYAALQQFKKTGSYTFRMGKNTRFISFNSIYYNHINVFRDDRNILLDEGMKWLYETLAASEELGEKVWFLTHMFPGAGGTSGAYTAMMLDIFYRFRNTIVYQFYGHTHNDQVTMYEKDGEIFGGGWTGPSMMPDSRFPSYRIYEYDKDSMKILDYTQYVANMSKVMTFNRIVYEPHYRYSEVYGEDLSVIGMYNGIVGGKEMEYCKYFTPGGNKCDVSNLVVRREDYDIPEPNVELR